MHAISSYRGNGPEKQRNTQTDMGDYNSLHSLARSVITHANYHHSRSRDTFGRGRAQAEEQQRDHLVKQQEFQHLERPLVSSQLSAELYTNVHRTRQLRQHIYYSARQHEWKKCSETQTLRAGSSKTEPKIFNPPEAPFPGARDGQNLISCLVWWG